MGEYICMKPMTLSGVDYAPGDRIPGNAVLRTRELALKRNGCIVEVGAEAPASNASKLPHTDGNGSKPIEIPIRTPEGLLTATVSSQSVVTAFSILQKPDGEAKEAVSVLDDDDALMLINAADRRKGVTAAARERHEMLAAKAGDADGKDV